MSHTKESLRGLFATFYKSKEVDRMKGNRKRSSREWRKFNIPDININLDVNSLRWWQLRKIRFGERPFNKFDQYCTDGALGALNQNVSSNNIASNNLEEEGFSKSSFEIVEGAQNSFTPYVYEQCENTGSSTFSATYAPIISQEAAQALSNSEYLQKQEADEIVEQALESGGISVSGMINNRPT